MKSRRGSRSKVSPSSPPLQLCDRLKNMETKTDIGKMSCMHPPSPPPPLWHRRYLISARGRLTSTLSLFCASVAEACLMFLKSPSSYYWGVFFQFCTNQSLLNARRWTGEFPCHGGKENCIQGNKWVTSQVTTPPFQSHSAPGKCLSCL